MKKTNKLISILIVLAMLLSMAPIAVFTASAAGTPSYSTTSEGVRLYANGTNLFIEAGTASGTAVYYMNGSTKTYVNPNGAKGNDLSNSEIYMGTASSNDDYLDVSLVMTGGEVGTIYTAKSYGYLIGNVTVAVTGTAKAGLIWCGSKYGPDSGQDLHGKNGNLAIFNTVGAEIHSGSTGFDGLIKYTESGWEISGNAVIPEGATMTVASGQTVTVPADAAVENNGALVNNGTLELYGAVTGNNITGNGTINCHTAYIENVSSVSSISAKINGESVELLNGQYRVLDGNLYIWLPDGNAQVTLNSVKYYGVVARGERVALTAAYTAPNDISGIPSEIIAYVSEPLSPKTNSTTFDADFTYEVLTSGTTAADAKMTGTSLYASGAGTIKLKITASDAYTSYSETFTVTVKDAGYAASVANGNIVISKYSDTQIKVTHAGFDGGYIIIGNDDVLLITGTSDAEKDYGITVESGTAKVIFKDVSITRANDCDKPPVRMVSGATLYLSLAGTNVLTDGRNTYGGSSTSDGETNAGLHVPEGATLIIDGEGALDVNGGNTSAGIGGGKSVACGNITINGGTVTATGGTSGAGIGGGCYVAGGNITINGGTVTATGGHSGAGIGGGDSGADGGNITINGGTVSAKGGSFSAGIGGGCYGAGGTITVNGGTVTAAGTGGAGIGGGYKGAGATVTISGGTVTATGIDGAGIGGGGCAYASQGAAGDGGTVTISGGTVTATGTYGAGIGGGGVDDLISEYDATAGAGGMITISGGTVVAQSTGSYGGAGIGSGGSRYGTGNSGGTVVITGGNIKATSNGGEAIGKGYNGTDSGTLKNADGNDLTLNTITLSGAAADTAVTKVEGINYGLTDVKTLDTDKLYFWLPADTAATSITAGGNEYICNGNLTYYTAHSWANNDGICANGCGTECDHAGQSGESCEICGAALHTHSFTYSASGDTITAVCENTDGNCTDTNGGTLTILAPADLYVDGITAKEATIENNLVDTSVAISDITYSAPYGLPPKDAGTYTASVTVGGATATVEFTLLNYAAKVTDKDGNAVGTYKTFAEAVTAAEGSEGSTITLLDDITLTAEQYVYSGKFTLDLNGKKIISENYNTLYIFGNADLTINDSSEGGTIESKEQGYYAVYNYGTLTVESGVIKGDGGIDNIGTLIFKNGKIEAGTYSAIKNSDTAYVYNGILESSNESALYNDTDSTLYVYDGELSGNSAISNRGSVYIEGGEFTGNAVAALNLLGGKLEVTGGSFTGTDFASGYYSGTPYGEWTVCYNEDATLILKGGEFPNGFVVDETTANTFLAEDYYYKDAGGKLIDVAEDAKIINGYVKVSKGADLADAVVTVDKTEFVYNGQHQAPAVTVTIGGKTLTENVDYAVNARRWENDVPVQWFYYVDAGVYTSVITGLGDYTGTVEKEFVINPATVDIIWEGDEFYYTGNPHKVTAKYVDVNGNEIEAASITNGENTEIGKYIATAVVEDSNYTVNGATINHAYEIKWYDGAPDATVSGTKGENGWYTSEVTVTAPEGYTISTAVDGTYDSEITFGNEENAVYYLKQTENGYIAKVELGEIKCDLADPAAEITMAENKWNSFFNTVTFGYFFKETQSITITASDETSGIAKIEYVVATEEITDFENAEWIEYTEAFTIQPNSKNIIYAKATDNAGRYVIVNSDGIVVYSDSQVTTADTLTYTLTTVEDVEYSVDFKGNTVAYVKINNDELNTDEYEVTENSIIIKGEYIENLAADVVYEIVTGINPMGETYADGDAPAEMKAYLAVEKITGSVIITNDISKVYDGTPVEAPQYETIGTGEVTIKYTSAIGEPQYTDVVPTEAGTYFVVVEIAETNKSTYDFSVAEFTISKADSVITAAPTPNTLTYNGEAHNLISAGEAMYGTMVYSLDGAEYSETIPQGTDAGDYTVYYKIIGDSNHNDTGPATVTITINAKDISDGFIILGDPLTYNGKEQTQTVEKVIPTGTAPEATYTVSDNKATNVGVYLLTVTGTGNFTGEAKIAFEIAVDMNGVDFDQLHVFNVKSTDKERIEYIYNQVDNAFRDYADEAKRNEWDNLKSTCVELLKMIESVTDHLESYKEEVAGYDIDTVTSDDYDYLESLSESEGQWLFDHSENYTEEEIIEFSQVNAALTKLLIRISDVAKEITRITDAVNSYDEATVKYGDYKDILQLIDDIEALTTGKNITDFERADLEELNAKANLLAAKIRSTADEISRITRAVNAYSIDTVKSSDKADIENLIARIRKLTDGDNITADERANLNELDSTLDALLAKIDETADEITRITNAVNSYDEATVKSRDKTDIEKLKADIKALADGQNITAEERANLNELDSTLDALLAKIAETKSEYDRVIAAANGYDEATVTSADKDTLVQLNDDIYALALTDNVTEEEKENLQAAHDKVLGLIDKLTDISDEIKRIIEAVDKYMFESVKSSDKADIEQLIADIKALLDTKNITADEKTLLSGADETCTKLIEKIDETVAEINRINDATNAYDEATVTSADKADIEKLFADIKALTDGDNVTDAEREQLNGNEATLNALLDKIGATADEIERIETAVNGYGEESVKSSDKADLEQLKADIKALTDATNVTEDERTALETLDEKADALIKKIDDTAAEIERINEAVNGYDEETVKSSDIPELGKLIEDIKVLTDGDNLTEDEKAALEETEKAIDELVEKLAEVAEEIKKVDEAVKSYDEETVKSTDSEDLTQLKEDIQNLINSDNTTENEKTALEEMIKDIEGLEDKITETEEKLEEIKNIENNYNPENVSSDDKAAIEDKIAEIEAVNPDNLTDEQKTEYEEIKAGFEALLDKIEEASKAVTDIAVELEMFDEERVTKFWEDDIEALKAKIDELLADENMGEAEKAKLNEYKAQAEKLIEIINTPKEYISCRFFYLIWDCLTWKYNGILWLFSKIFAC